LFELGQWNFFLKKRVHLIACGGTALTLAGIKESTKDVDFMVPVEKEYDYLISVLKDLGYERVTGFGWQREDDAFRYDLFRGNFIHTTELFESPIIEGRHELLKEFSRIYVGVLNDYDLIASKLFRGLSVDIEDCMMLVEAHKENLDIKHLEAHSKELASYDVSADRIIGVIDHFMELLKERNLYD
jgi:hypothetical protein